MLGWTFHQFAGFLPRRSAARVSARVATQAPGSGHSLKVSLAPNPHLAARRAQAMRGMFPKLSSWFSGRYNALGISEINEYLAQASNVTDLEQRIQLIQRQRHFS